MARQYYQGNRFSNPFTPKKERKKRSWKSAIFLSVFGLIVMIGLVLFSTLFAITNVTIQGASHETEEATQGMVREHLSDTSRLILFRTKKIQQQLSEQYSFESVIVSKDYPHTLIITVQERTPRAIWQTSEHAYLIDQTGAQIKEIDLQAPRRTDVVYFFDESGAVPAEHVIEKIHLDQILEIKQLMEQELDLEIPIIRVESATSSFVKYLTHHGWEAYIDLNEDRYMQLEKLETILNDLGEEIAKINYIDVRFADRVYYQ